MHHQGFTKLEMLVSASLLTTMIGIATPLLSHLNQVWHSTRMHQLASQELMNQMDAMMQLSPEEYNRFLSELKISEELRAVIPDARLTGKMGSSPDGNRVVLSFQLPASIRSEPILLVGWLRGEVFP